MSPYFFYCQWQPICQHLSYESLQLEIAVPQGFDEASHYIKVAKHRFFCGQCFPDSARISENNRQVRIRIWTYFMH